MAQKPTPALPVKFPGVKALSDELKEIAAGFRVTNRELSKTPEEDRDYPLFIREGSKELAITDSIRRLRKIEITQSSQAEIIRLFTEYVAEQQTIALSQSTNPNPPNKDLGEGGIVGLELVAGVLSSFDAKASALAIAQ